MLVYRFHLADRAELDCVYPIKIGEYLAALGKHIFKVWTLMVLEISLNLIGSDGDLVIIDET